MLLTFQHLLLLGVLSLSRQSGLGPKVYNNLTWPCGGNMNQLHTQDSKNWILRLYLSYRGPKAHSLMYFRSMLTKIAHREFKNNRTRFWTLTCKAVLAACTLDVFLSFVSLKWSLVKGFEKWNVLYACALVDALLSLYAAWSNTANILSQLPQWTSNIPIDNSCYSPCYHGWYGVMCDYLGRNVIALWVHNFLTHRANQWI